jgi:nucleoside-diphosphate-sugar epimerase
MGKKVLVIGATGVMGQYLIPYLAEAGYTVDAVSLEEKQSQWPNVKYITANVKEQRVLKELLTANYDGIVDFMIYPTAELAYFPPLLLDHTGHYIYLSSYRIYDNKEHPVRETSPRLLDTADDIILRNSDDYSVYKARGENIVRTFPKDRWTIIRPAITYSFMRYQLVTLEAPNTVGRAFAGKKVAVPEQARDVQATMSWAGDVARMIERLLFNEKALGETFSVCTAEHHTWGEIADYYKDICGLDAVWIDKEDYLRLLNSDPYNFRPRWQLECDRMFDRVMDNSKVLAATGLEQSGLIPLYDGLKKEIARCPKDHPWRVNTAMDEYLATH